MIDNFAHLSKGTYIITEMFHLSVILKQGPYGVSAFIMPFFQGKLVRNDSIWTAIMVSM